MGVLIRQKNRVQATCKKSFYWREMLSLLYFIFIFTGQGFVLAQSENSTDELIFLEEEEEMKPGFQMIKEFHFHPYWHQNNPEEEAAALSLRDAIVNEVAISNMTVVCDGVNSGILSGLNDSQVSKFNRKPAGPHPVGNFQIWTPQEYFSQMLSFLMDKRGNISVLLHPLGKNPLRDHTADAMWLGEKYPLDLSALSPDGGFFAQYPELGIGLNNSMITKSELVNYYQSCNFIASTGRLLYTVKP